MFRKSSKTNGFSLIEVVIAIILLIGIMSVMVTLTLGGIKTGRTSQNIADLRILASDKLGEITNNLDAQLKLIPASQQSVGSINPFSAVGGYFDVLNENGCVIKSAIKGVDPIDPNEKEVKSGLGDLGDGGGEISDNAIDCSKSTFGKSSNSVTPRFRRQWVVVRNVPNKGDNTISVVIIDLVTNQIVRSQTLVKVEGVGVGEN